MKIAGDGVGQTRWKVPGVLDWSNMHYNPYVDVSRDTTTLYASDRDVFLFLVDDTHPIEAGQLPNGEPALYFRGFYRWNSERSEEHTSDLQTIMRITSAVLCLKNKN